jgi:hypothetical protein
MNLHFVFEEQVKENCEKKATVYAACKRVRKKITLPASGLLSHLFRILGKL